MKLLVYILFLLTFLVWVRSESCTKVSHLRKTLSDESYTYTNERCWLIEVPFNFYLLIDFHYLTFQSEVNNVMEIIEAATGRKYTIDSEDKFQELVFHSNVQITHYAKNRGSEWYSSFYLTFEISKFPVEGVSESLESAISRLKEYRSSSKEWEDVPRAIVALFLASAANFSESNNEEQLMTTQLALETTVALLRTPIPNNRLSMLVNALLVSCYNPRHFYGKNLVKLLKTQVEATQGFTHPLAYLTLCNANETWPSKALNDINNILSTESEYLFARDIQAIAILALSCIRNRGNIFTEGSNTSALYNKTISSFKSFQHEDGSFGNSHTTALITHALIAENKQDIDMILRTTIQYLMKELNSSSVDFLSMYLIVPILNKKTLTDISNTHCSSNPMNRGDDIVTEVNNRSGPKMRVRYSLYIGDEKDVIHTISLRVPGNFTAYEVMQMAQNEDQKYKFEVKNVSGKVYVYKIANITNDPEDGKFWLQYVSTTNNTSNLTNFSTNPDELTMNNGQHLVMWYKTANI